MSDSIVIIPTYNEMENIENIINVTLSLPKKFHILIIDDGSPDGTANIVKKLQIQHTDSLFLLERKGKQGLGTAYIAGFKWALSKDYEYIFEMDADFSHNPNDLEKLYKSCKEDGADMSIGSRYCTGVNVVNWPISRVIMSYYASKYVKLITRMDIHDATAGFVCYKRKVLEAINLNQIRFKGYAFQIEMKYTTYCLGFNLKEVSIIFVNRILGESKMNAGIFGEAFFGVIKLRMDKLMGHYKRKP